MGTNGERFIFVGGAPRSGTTLVQNMLDCHPDVWGGPEFLHLPDITAVRDKLRDSVGRGWIDHYVSREQLDALTRGLIEALLLPAADGANKKWLSEKSPQNVFAFAALVEMFPAAHFLHVVRDPRAVVASLLQVGTRAKEKGVPSAAYTYTCSGAIAYTRKCLEAGFAATRSAPGRIYTVVYEQLVQNPDPASRALCAYLGIDWTEQMLRPGDVQHVGEKAITQASGEVWYDQASYQRNIDAHSLEDWRQKLTPAQQHEITAAFAGHVDLENLGYQFDATALPHLDASARAAMLGSRLAQAAKRRARRMLGKVNH